MSWILIPTRGKLDLRLCNLKILHVKGRQFKQWRESISDSWFRHGKEMQLLSEYLFRWHIQPHKIRKALELSGLLNVIHSPAGLLHPQLAIRLCRGQKKARRRINGKELKSNGRELLLQHRKKNHCKAEGGEKEHRRLQHQLCVSREGSGACGATSELFKIKSQAMERRGAAANRPARSFRSLLGGAALPFNLLQRPGAEG